MMDVDAQPETASPPTSPSPGLSRYSRLIFAATVAAGAMVLGLWVMWGMAIAPDGIDQSGTPVGWDFRAFYNAATALSDRAPLAMYESPWPAGAEGPPFVNPPFTALFFLPLVMLDVVPAWVLWSALSLMALAIGLRALGVRSWPIATAAALFTVPVFFSLRLGQTSLIVFLLMSLAYAALRSGKLRTGGALLGFIVFKPQLLIGFVFWWLSRLRQMRPAIVGGFAVGGSLIALSLIALPFAWVRFFEVVGTLPELYAFGDSPYYEFAMWNLIVRDDPVNPGLISTLSIALTIAAGLGLVWFVRRVRDDLPLVYSGAIAVALIGSAHIVVHDWTLLLIAAVLLWQRLPRERLALAAMGLALLYTTLLWPFFVLYQLEAFGVAVNAAPMVLVICTVIAAFLAIRQVDEEQAALPPVDSSDSVRGTL